MRNPLQAIREQFHPLYHMRKSTLGRWLIRVADTQVWLSIPGVHFKVRGRLVTHGVAFSAAGSNEPNAEAMVLTCFDRLGLKSFWDVGANIGVYTWLLKSAHPELRAVLVEASPANAALVRNTLSRNRLADIELIEAGASDSEGTGQLRLDSEAGATSTLDQSTNQTFEEEHWGVTSKRVAIPLITLDDARTERPPVHFMKVDVEGHEAAVLRGAEKMLASDQPILLIECFHKGHPCLEPLARLGYHFLDADKLVEESTDETSNYFAFPSKFHDAIATLVKAANERLSGQPG